MSTHLTEVQEGVMWEKSIPGRGNGPCKGSEQEQAREDNCDEIREGLRDPGGLRLFAEGRPVETRSTALP